VVEAPTPSAKRLRDNGKTDTLDAVTAARSTIVTDLDDLRDRRRGQVRAALNILTVARDQMATERTRTVNTLTALIRSYDLGIDARRALSAAQLTEIASWRRRDETIGLAVARAEAVRLARRIKRARRPAENQSCAARRDSCRARPATAGTARGRSGHRCGHPHRLVTPRPDQNRGRAGEKRWDCSDSSIIGQHHPASAQPRRRSTAQQSDPHDRAHRGGSHIVGVATISRIRGV
jgi:hypothetical protein